MSTTYNIAARRNIKTATLALEKYCELTYSKLNGDCTKCDLHIGKYTCALNKVNKAYINLQNIKEAREMEMEKKKMGT